MTTHSIATPGHLAQTGHHAAASGRLTLTAVIVIALLALGLVASLAAAWLDLRADS